jgi:hypothetical protein
MDNPSDVTADGVTSTESGRSSELDAWAGLDGRRAPAQPERPWPEPYFSTVHATSRW